MKRVSSIIMLISAALHAETTDILKPEYHRQEQELKRILEQLDSKEVKYKAVMEKVEHTYKTGGKYFISLPTVRFPDEIKEKIVKYDQRFARWHFAIYLDDPKYSFYAALLILGRGPEFWGGGGRGLPDSIAKDMKELWWNRDFPAEKERFINMSTHCNFKRGRSEFVPPEAYYGAILFESIPPRYNNRIFAERVYKKDWLGDMSEPNPFLPYGDINGRQRTTGQLYGIFFEAFLNDNNKETLKDIALVQPCVEHWLYLTLFGDNEKQLLALEGMLAWSRMNTPVENPFLSALAMGLFTINGYAFNDETGVYTMNERGKMLMDFIVEFPIPENATRLQAVMNGGNKEEIEGMMKKHGTTEKWAELLKNPVHPEFAKYPQD